MSEQGYRKLEIYKRAHRLAVDIHKMSMGLPRHELYEEGGQIRRSSKSVAAQIVEGYCLRKNKNEFLQYLNRAYASAHETVEHLNFLFETGSLVDAQVFGNLHSQYDELCRMIFGFMQSVVEGHGRPAFVGEGQSEYESAGVTSAPSHPTSEMPHPSPGNG
jgi:four helix bundle protein